MNIRNSFSLLLALLFLSLVATVQSSSAVVPQKGPEAFGEGQYRIPGAGERINFSFDAKANENGKAHGQAQFTFTRSLIQTEVTVRVTCLIVGDPSAASIIGVVQHSDDPRYPKHAFVDFAAIDKSNFPVPSSNPDQMTPLFVVPEQFLTRALNCDPFFPLTILDLDFGDIEIEP